MTLLTLFELLVLAGWSCIVLYGFAVTLISWITKRREMPLIYPRHMFALIIPAENDEGIIGKTVDHLRRMKYPRKMFEIIVVPVNSTDQTAAVARRKGANVYGPGKRKWRDKDDAVLETLERLSSKERFDGFIVLDAMARVSANYLNVLSDKLSKGAQIVQSGYHISGSRWSLGTALRALLAAISPSWLTGWSDRFRLGGGLHRIGYCLSKKIIEKHSIRNPAITDLDNYIHALLVNDVVITNASKAKIYDCNPSIPPVKSVIDRSKSAWRRIRYHAVPMIRAGIEWRSTAQILGGVNTFIPSFTGMITIGLCFLALGFWQNGISSGMTTAWLILNCAMALLVLLRLVYMKAPVIAFVGLPVLPLILWWRALRSCLTSPAPPAPPPQVMEKQGQRKRKSRQRRSSQRQARRQPSQ